jgi:AhpD family alkylhydroperoxidase
MPNTNRPNIHDTINRAPGVLDAYKAMIRSFNHGSLSRVERHTILMAASVENVCTYCVPVYTIHLQKAGMAPESIERLRAGKEIDDERLNTLALVTRELIRTRGDLPTELRERFLEVGFKEEQLLEVILGVAQKVITNYTNALFHPPLEAELEAVRWDPARDG